MENIQSAAHWKLYSLLYVKLVHKTSGGAVTVQ